MLVLLVCAIPLTGIRQIEQAGIPHGEPQEGQALVFAGREKLHLVHLRISPDYGVSDHHGSNVMTTLPISCCIVSPVTA